jgi:hypothetical protein
MSTAGNTSNIQDIKEHIAHRITEKVFDQLLTNVMDYHALLTDDKKFSAVMKSVIHMFTDKLLECCLQKALNTKARYVYHGINSEYNNVSRLIGTIKAHTQLVNLTLVQVLRALNYGTFLADNLHEKRDICFRILREYFSHSRQVWCISMKDFKMKINMSTMSCTMNIKTSDIEKITTFANVTVRPHDAQSPDVVVIDFQFTKDRIADIAKLFQSLYGKYTFVSNDTIDVHLDVGFETALQKGIMNDLQKIHFNNVIKI